MNTRRNARNEAVENSAGTNINRVINAEPGQVLPMSPARQSRDLAAPQALTDEYFHSGMEEASPTPPDPPVRAKTTKKTPDVRWSQIMKDKLVQQVYFGKAYKRTAQTMEQKYTAIKATLEGDRDFAELAGVGKCWEAFKSQWVTIYKTFMAKYALDQEGSNLSCFDPDMMEKFSGTEKILYDIAKEIEAMDEDKREKSDKDKKRAKECLTHEKRMLERFPSADAPNSADRSIATSAITDEDFTNSNKRSHSSMSVLEALLPNHAMLASPSKEDVKLKQIEAKNKQLELRIQLEAMKMGRAVSELTKKRKVPSCGVQKSALFVKR